MRFPPLMHRMRVDASNEAVTNAHLLPPTALDERQFIVFFHPDYPSAITQRHKHLRGCSIKALESGSVERIRRPHLDVIHIGFLHQCSQ